MKLILFWLCITSANAITTPLWSIYTNDNLPPPYFRLYSSQQLQNGFQIPQNSPMLGLSFHQPLSQPNPNQNVRFPQVLSAANSQRFIQNLPYSNQPIQKNPNLHYIRPNQGFVEYNPAINNRWIQPTKKKQNKKTKSKARNKSKPNGHSFPVIYIDANPERDNYRHKFENSEGSSVSSDHEVPQEIPTKPIYPGERQWAKRGKKHRPHVTKHKFKDLEDSTEPNVGHEIFDKAKTDFEKKKNKFNKDVRLLPQKHTATNDYQDDYYDDTSTEEFVPYKTYSQVRHSESEKHLPFPSPEDERLKESITDSKTHTVYTEEGYEDSAYDHADREKNADNTEVYVDARKETVETKQPKQKESGKKVSKPGNASESASNSDRENSSIRPTDLLSVDQRINSKYETTTLTQPEDSKPPPKEYEKQISVNSPKTENSKNFNEHLYRQSVNTYNHPNVVALAARQNQNLTEQQIYLTEQQIFLPTNKPEINYANIVNIYSEYSNESPSTPSITTKFLEGVPIQAKILNRKKRMVTEDVKQNKSKTSTTDHNKEKYPYYNLKSVEENSPLKYSENLNNVPDKKPGVMAFYDQADQIECEEVESDVNPLPNRVRNSENVSKTEDNEAPAPRLGKLGDKIDCFKAKYFGENPLDNPLFKEDLIGTPRTIFENLSPSKQSDSSKYREKSSVNNKNEADEISHMIQDYINYEVTENIEDNLDDNDYMIERIKETVAEDPRREKVSDIILGRYLREEPTPNLKYLDESKKLSDRSDSDDLPESSPYIMKRRLKPYRATYRRTSVSPVIYNNNYRPSQITHKPFSEVHYKDEIKPSEQLNVFADIINNIKAATEEADTVPANIQSTHIETTSIRSRPRRRKLPSRNYKVKTTTNLPFVIGAKDVLKSYQLTSTAVPFKYKNYISEDMRNYMNPIGESFSKIDSFKDKVELIRENEPKPSFWTPMAKDKNNNISPLEADGINENFIPNNHRIEEATSKFEVHGLLPPREIHTSRPYSPSDSEATPNNFNVIGMRPPPIKSAKRRQSHVKKRRVSYPHRLRIVKRSARRGYSEIRRQSKKIEENPEQEEDYVPHRPKTYRYDVEKGRIIYDKKPENEEPEPESYEYVDVVEEVTTAKPKKEKEKKEERVLKFPEKPPEGPTYIDFIKQLKSDPSYHDIPDPKPTEKTTTLTPSTETPVSTTEPEFLSILAKVRSDVSYKTIEDEKKSKAKEEKVAEAKEEASEIEEEEEVLKDIQNSPGGQINSFASSQLDIFDISEYLPKVKNYSPSTNVDTSKYKSIERVTITRHNSDSRYSSEDEPEGDGERSRNVATTSSQSRTLQAPTSTNRPTAPLPQTDKPEVQEQPRKTTSRGRRRPTTTQPPIEESTDKANARRSRGKSRFRSTTSSPTDEIRESTRRRRNLQRKNNKNLIPRNHKSHYSAVDPDGSTPKEKEIVTSRAITIDTLKETNITNMPSENATEKTDDVEIFKNFDKTQKHGGNYKYKKVEIRVSQGTNYVPPTAYEIEDSEEIKRLTDVVPKPFAFYSDPKLPSRINSLTEANNRDSAGEGLKDELQFFEEAVRVNSESTTRKPNFIKDPSKRLYFYAPVE